jgi:hypothetical protein
MALLDSFYGETPQYLSGLLGADELSRLQEQARGQSNLGMATALLRAGGPSRTPTSSALAIAEGLQSGQDIYKKALNQGLQEKMVAMQLGEQARKMQEGEAVRQFLPQIFQPARTVSEQNWSGAPEQIGDYFSTGAIPTQTTTVPASINRDALQRLALAAPEQFAKYSAGLKAMQPEYKEVNGQLFEISPFGGTPVAVAGQKKEDLAGPVKQAMQVLGINKPFAEVTPQERSMIGQYIDRQESFKQPKVTVDLKDPTAVAKAQADLLKDWRGVVKDSGATEVANRFRSLGAALDEANKGNKTADGAIIYNIGKIYDPSGAVQEGDKNTILGNRSIPNEVKAYAQKVFEGGSLLPNERTGLYSVARAMVEQRQKQLQADQSNYKALSSQLGGTGDFIKDPYADVFSPRVEGQVPSIADAARAELMKRRGQ